MSKTTQARFSGRTVADFKDHIRQIKRAGDGLSLRGAARANPILVRGRKTETNPEGAQHAEK